jgi:hypothetical protein
MTTDKKADPGEGARPLRVLEPLIRKDLEAAHKAGLPHFRAAGEKMIEAQVSARMKHAEFSSWLKRHFDLSYSHASKYMQLARTDPEFIARNKWTSLSDFIRGTSSQGNGKARASAHSAPAQEPERARDRAAQASLAEKIISTGYRKLAEELHPDKGGSKEDMQRLNGAREDLKKKRPIIVTRPAPPWWEASPQEIAMQMVEHMPSEKIWKILAATSDALKKRQAQKAQKPTDAMAA